jgi:hypothetical protein
VRINIISAPPCIDMDGGVNTHYPYNMSSNRRQYEDVSEETTLAGGGVGDSGEGLTPATASVAGHDAAPDYAWSVQALAELVELTSRLTLPGSSAAGAGDLLAGLSALRRLRDEIAGWEPVLIGAARDRGASWAEIAPVVGVTSRQAAEKRYLRLNPHQSDQPDTTGDQRVQATRDRRAGERAVAGWARDNSATLRQLAGQITALDDLGRSARHHLDRLQDALGSDDAAELVNPLIHVAPYLGDSHPALATRLAELGHDTDQLRSALHHRRAGGGSGSDPGSLMPGHR